LFIGLFDAPFLPAMPTRRAKLREQSELDSASGPSRGSFRTGRTRARVDEADQHAGSDNKEHHMLSEL
jgi:hypothetical protein